jgi:curli biogenesis system outer membrane secretion channel CsgG
MNLRRRHIILLRTGLALSLAALLTGCCCFGGRSEPPAPRVPTRPSITPTVSLRRGNERIRKVAVLPFRAQTEMVGITVSDYFVSEILGSRNYELVERSQIGKVLSESELVIAGVSDAKAAEVGSMVGADGVVIGTVGDYETVARGGQTYAVVSIAARMIDTQNGKIVWSVDLTRRAEDSEATLSEHSRQVVHEMMDALEQALRRPGRYY